MIFQTADFAVHDVQRGQLHMKRNEIDRRSLLQTFGAAGMLSALPAGGNIIHEVAQSNQEATQPTNHIKFAVIGVDHSHIRSMTAAVLRGGGELAAFYATPETVASFQRRYPNAKLAASEDEILNDKSIQLVCSASIPNLRAPLGIRVMQHGKDFLSDKPAITTLEQLADVRKAIQETGRIFGIMYGRLESRATMHAGTLVKGGAIGRVVQTVQLAP